MGSIVTFKCLECGYEREFLLGAGMMDYNEYGRKRLVRDILRGQYGEEAKRMLEKNPNALIYRSDELFYCEDCREYTSESVVRFYKIKKFLWSEKRKLLKSSAHSCRCCKKEMTRIEDAENVYHKIACPKCQTPMKSIRTGHWD